MDPPRYDRLTFSLYVSGTLAPPPRRPPDVVLKKSLIGSKLTVESVFFFVPARLPLREAGGYESFQAISTARLCHH